ncbi:hypothetical protein CDN99_01010 [Roseateles aquatilis]|uniref:Uncharacterized protein n=1 Tax=Roseateles aquatilis TaxID=431061 RepID=A0A246JKD7_9BURK|nr:hypothetical protein [Roseateles aquatilis]OWQ93114.1 hypothetical protein CDN99_01010 [Roseateles aquatilis]
MIRRLPLLLAALLLATGLVSPARADDFLHQPTNVRIPDTIAGFVRKDIKDLEASTPGHGVQINFAKEGAYTATLFIYTDARIRAAASLSDEFIVQAHRLSAEQVLTIAKLREPTQRSANSRRLGPTAITQARTTPEPTPMYSDFYIVYLGGRATFDKMDTWLARGHLWKLRLTRVPGSLDNDTGTDFVFGLAQLSIDGQCAPDCVAKLKPREVPAASGPASAAASAPGPTATSAPVSVPTTTAAVPSTMATRVAAAVERILKVQLDSGEPAAIETIKACYAALPTGGMAEELEGCLGQDIAFATVSNGMYRQALKGQTQPEYLTMPVLRARVMTQSQRAGYSAADSDLLARTVAKYAFEALLKPR